MQAELEEKAEGLPNDQKQELLREYQSRLTEKEQVIVQEIVDSIKEIIIKIAKEKQVRMVLDKSNVLYGGYDMTEEVIAYIKQNITEDTPENSDTSNIDDDTNFDENVLMEIE
jgi:outer membrane protein